MAHPTRVRLIGGGWQKGISKGGCTCGYRRLGQRLGGSVWRVQTGWGAVRAMEAVGRAARPREWISPPLASSSATPTDPLQAQP